MAEEFQARTQETHSRHCFAISSTSDEVRKANTTTFGICRDSILNTSKYYHVTEGLCPDVMHDMLEGCAQYEVKELLGVLISKALNLLNLLNQRIQTFPYLVVMPQTSQQLYLQPLLTVQTTLSSKKVSLTNLSLNCALIRCDTKFISY